MVSMRGRNDACAAAAPVSCSLSTSCLLSRFSHTTTGPGLPYTQADGTVLIRGGGARINDAVADNETRPVTLEDLSADGVVKLSAGKKRHALVKPV